MKSIKTTWGVAVVLIIWLIFSSDYFFRGLVPFPSTFLVSFFPPWSAYYGMPVKNGAMPDIITQIFPWRHLTIESWKLGELPLWNPYSFSGTQQAGNYQSAPFSPFNILFFVLHEIDAWSLLVLLQPLLAGLCMYFFVRTLGRSKHAGILSAVSFMFCGFATVWMGYGTLVHAALWLPFILAGIHGYVTKIRWWYAACIPTGVALSLVSGHFQISLYVLGFSAAYCLYLAFFQKKRYMLVPLLALLLLGVFFALPQLVSAYSAYSQSPRSESFSNHGGIPFHYLMTLFAPDFYGNPVTRNDWFGQYAEWASFAGVVPLLLGVYAVIRRKLQGTVFFLAAAIVALAFATPTPLNSLLYSLKIPVISTSAGSRIVILFSFCVAVLAAFGLDQAIRDWKDKQHKGAFMLGGGVVVFLLIVWGILLLGQPFPDDKLGIARRNTILPSAFAVAGSALLCLGFMRFRKVSLVVVLPFLLIATTGMDTVRFAKKWMPFEPKEFVYPNINVIAFLTEHAGSERIYGTFGNELVTYFGLRSIEGYDAVYQARYGEFISAAGNGMLGKNERSVVHLNKNGEHAQRYLELLGVRYLVHRASDGQNVWAYPFWKYPFYVKVYGDEGYEVYENQRALPRARLVSEYDVRNNQQEIISLLVSKDFPYDKRIILEQKPENDPAEGEGSVEIVGESPNAVVLATDSETHKLLFLSDVYEKGWQASVDGLPVPIYKANYAFRAIEVPPGMHKIRFQYKPKAVLNALAVSGIGVLVFVIMSGRKILYEYRNR